jgi:urease accessory protein
MLKIEINRGAGPSKVSDEKVDDTLLLSYEQRTKGRLRATTEKGQDVGIFLERGKTLKHGDLLESDDGQVIRVEAKIENLIKGSGKNWHLFSRCCYHLGNRHVAIQIGECELWIQSDHILKDMLAQLGMHVSECMAPFEPEQGAYAGGHHGHHEH